MMLDQPLVSVLMTAYNREQYIAQAIESVLASTFEGFELIIVDDASTDCTVEIAQRYLCDGRVQVHVNPKNLGDYPNRNRAAELARGKYLKYVDSDDYLYPHGLAVMVDSIERFPEAGLGLSRPCMPTQPYPVCLSPAEAYHDHFFVSGLLSSAPLSAIILYKAFQSVGRFSGKPYVGDVELWLKIAACYPVVKMPKDLGWWRPHAQQEARYEVAGRTVFYSSWSRYIVAAHMLTAPACPLPLQERNKALQMVRADYRHALIYYLIKTRQIRTTFHFMRLLYTSSTADVNL